MLVRDVFVILVKEREIEKERERTYRPIDDDVPLGKINLQIPVDPL